MISCPSLRDQEEIGSDGSGASGSLRIAAQEIVRNLSDTNSVDSEVRNVFGPVENLEQTRSLELTIIGEIRRAQNIEA